MRNTPSKWSRSWHDTSDLRNEVQQLQQSANPQQSVPGELGGTLDSPQTRCMEAQIQMKTCNDNLRSFRRHIKTRTLPAFPPTSTAWAVLYFASMEICDRHGLPGGERVRP
jgi:hypothetical protein